MKKTFSRSTDLLQKSLTLYESDLNLNNNNCNNKNNNSNENSEKMNRRALVASHGLESRKNRRLSENQRTETQKLSANNALFTFTSVVYVIWTMLDPPTDTAHINELLNAVP